MKKRNSIMRKMTITVIVLTLLIVSYRAKAAIMYNNTISTSTYGSVTGSGLMNVDIGYDGIQGITTRGEITTYIEKRFLGIFWTRVSIGQADNQWVDIIYNYRYNSSHSHQLTSTGTYRATVTYKIYGTGGDPDEITSQVTVTY